MKLRLLMVLPLIILAFIPSNVIAGTGCGSNWLGSDSNDPDFWVSKNQNLGISNVGTSSQLSKSQPAPDAVNNITSMSAQRIAASYAEPPNPDLPDLNGKWLVRFEGNDERSMDMILIQTKEDIIGSGNLNEGKDNLQILAKGSFENQNIMLDVKTVVGEFVNKIDKRYKLALIPNNKTLSGNYEEYSGEISVNRGNITVTRLGA